MNAVIPILPVPALRGATEGAADRRDPTDLLWPPSLPIELALHVADPQELRVEYGFSEADWAALPHNPAFLADLATACELVRQEGMTFRLKAKLIAEEHLKDVWKLTHAPNNEVPPAVKADLIKAVARWAGFDAKDAGQGAVNAPTLQIAINLGSEI